MSIPNRRDGQVRPTHPGEMLREDFMLDYGFSVSGIAKALGVSRQTVNSWCASNAGSVLKWRCCLRVQTGTLILSVRDRFKSKKGDRFISWVAVPLQWVIFEPALRDVQLLLEILRQPVSDQRLIGNRLHRRNFLNCLDLEGIHLNRDILQVSSPFAR